jgi:hypothetical protein
VLALLYFGRWSFNLELWLVFNHDHLLFPRWSFGWQLAVFDVDVRNF